MPGVPRWRGADISFTLQEEAIGTRLHDVGSDVPQPIEQILAHHGATAARLRVWVDPPPDYSTEASLLTLSRRVHEAGLEIVLDLHYSDFWADQTAQNIPAAWRGQSLSQLRDTVRRYTAGLITDLTAQGTPPSIVQIGNEVTNGMLWPAGQVYSAGHEEWTGFTELLKAGVQGVQDASGRSAPPATMVHLQNTNNLDGLRHTLDHIFDEGVVIDLIGLSYYPFWDGPLAQLKAVLHDLASRYGKDLVVVETSYPWTLTVAGENTLYAATSQSLPDEAACPPTPAGQAAYFNALKRILSTVPNQHGAGYLAWEPGWLPGVAAHPGTGNPYANLTMFDDSGAGLPALTTFADTLG